MDMGYKKPKWLLKNRGLDYRPVDILQLPKLTQNCDTVI